MMRTTESEDELRYIVPDSIAAACGLLADADTVAVAGGTSLVKRIARNPGKKLVSLSGLGLNRIVASSSRLEIGAMVTISELIAYNEVAFPALDMLRSAGSRMAGCFIRNAATVGGSAVACFRWSDLPAALLAASAEMVLFDGRREQAMHSDMFFESHPVRLFRSGALLTRISIPVATEGSAVFVKHSPLVYGYALWNIAVYARSGASRVAVSAGVALPRRLVSVERLLDQGVVGRRAVELAVSEELESLRVVGAPGISAHYRRAILPVLVADAVEAGEIQCD